MAALITSVMDKTTKVSEYILDCKDMGIKIQPPDVNESFSRFSVTENSIRYGLSAIKSIGRNVIESIVKEREENGRYTGLTDFIERLSGKDMNKRAVENFIKAGAFDSVPGTRKQKLMVFAQIMDDVSQKKKKMLEGQMSLFDFAPEEEKQNYEIVFQDVGEYDKETLLVFEKRGSGSICQRSSLENQIKLWEKRVTAKTTDFFIDEEGKTEVKDGDIVVDRRHYFRNYKKNNQDGKYDGFCYD
jgi:DNA polymerase-3 subunit alpha